MTSFLPASPRRKWHPRQWAIGTALVLGGCGDDTVSATDQGEQTGDSTDQTEFTDYTDHTDYSDYTEWTDYSDYSDYQDGYNPEWDGYTDSYWYPECYVDDDCGPGMICVNYYCEPEPFGECRTSSECEFNEYCDDNGACVGVQLPAQCLAPALQQIPLPDEAGGVVVALKFVDVDADAQQELVLLRDDAIVVIDLMAGEQAITVPHGAFELDGLAATDVELDGTIDLVATSSIKLNSRVFLGDGMGGFIDTGTGPAMTLDHAHGIDFPFGLGELVARTAADEAVILSNFVQQGPDIEVLYPGPIEGLAVGDFDGDSTDEAVSLTFCTPLVHQDGGLQSFDAFGPPGPCSIAVGDFDGDPIDDIVIVRADASFSVVNVLAPPGAELKFVGLAGAHQAAAPIDFGDSPYTLIVQAGAELGYLFTDPQSQTWCRGELDELPPVARFAVGDVDGDGDDELATVDQDGAVALWSDD